MNKIPTHKSSHMFDGDIAILKRISLDTHSHEVHYAHRDDYYMFIMIETGSAKMLIDFEEYDINENSIYYILPEQVHLLVDHSQDSSAWMLAVDSSLVTDEYKDIFSRNSSFKNDIELSKDTINELQDITSILNRRLRIEKEPIGQNIIYNMLSSYISIVAEVYNNTSTININKRTAIITSQFKSLLYENYKTLKKPSEYASKLNISPTYLNEAVKETTGLTVSECIRNEIIIRAKRLLFHTDMNVKEISLELGYEDWAYFSRIFSKSEMMSPTQFRERYRG